MSDKNYFIVWKGIKNGPHTKEALERIFVEESLGLVRNILTGDDSIPAGEFFADLQLKRREKDLQEQLLYKEQQAVAAMAELERQQKVHKEQLAEATNQSRSGKSAPPPIPDVNPWAPSSISGQHSTQSLGSEHLLTRGGKFPAETIFLWGGVFLCLLSLFSGHIFREVFAVGGVACGIVFLCKKRILTGIILIISALFSCGSGILLTDIIHDYLLRNYQH